MHCHEGDLSHDSVIARGQIPASIGLLLVFIIIYIFTVQERFSRRLGALSGKGKKDHLVVWTINATTNG
jgi:hypothetical protein